MSERKAVIFFTNNDFGQANVVLAVAYELLRQNKLDIHIASWAPLEPRLQALSHQVQHENPTSITTAPITFHTLPGSPMFDAWLQNQNSSSDGSSRKKADLPHPPGRHGAERLTALAAQALAPWAAPEHLELVDWCADLTRRLNPAAVVLDPFLAPAHDMARMLRWKHAILSPCTLAAGLVLEHRWLAGFWKYPALSTGFPYPLPWSKIPENLYCIWAVIRCLWQPQIQTLNRARTAHGIHGTIATFEPWVKDIPHICPSLPAIDFPMTIPSNAHFCGPILLATAPLASSDPGLLNWLKQRPTVLVSLGTHLEARADTVRELALGLRLLLDARPDIQVLWKLKAEKVSEEDDRATVHALLSRELQEGRVRIEGWLRADPLAILASGNVVCAVHHGGANSYFEATWAGIPQVVLPHWYDTYDYATRVEYLGIGVYGNRMVGHKCVVDVTNYVAPLMIEGNEFGTALLKVVGKTKGDAEAEAMRKRARALGEVCRTSGGRVRAAEIITDLVLGE